MDPSSSRFRSSAAAWPAAKPPIRRWSTLRSLMESPFGSLRLATVRPKKRLQVVLDAGVEHRQHLVPRLEDRVRPRHEPPPPAEDGDQEASVRQLEIPYPAPLDRRLLVEQQLDDLETLSRQVEQVHEAIPRHLVLDQPQDEVGRRHHWRNPEELET